MRFIFVALLAAVCVGCGGGEDKGKVAVYEITGTVKMNGEPLGEATVAFAPHGDQPTATGKTDEDGNLVMTTYAWGDGAAEGAYSVVISKVPTAAAAPDSGGDGSGNEAGHDDDSSATGHSGRGENQAGGGELVPAQYTSSDSTPLSVEVKANGDNNFDLEIN